jgi:Flp pilus assembly pilin Flp
MLLGLYVRAQTWWLDRRQRSLDEEGASRLEYVLLVVLIAVIIVGIVEILGGKMATSSYRNGHGTP